MRTSLMLLALLTALLAGCGAPATTQSTAAPSTAAQSTAAQSATTTEKTLEFWMVGDEAVTKTYRDIVDAFNQANPDTTIVFKTYGNEAYKTALQVAIGSARPPDIFFNWAGDDTFKLAREGHLAELTEQQRTLGWDTTLSTAAMDAFTEDGKLWGVPYSTEAKYFYYNKALFEKNNLAIPKTFNEFLNVCKTLRSQGITPLAFGNQERWEGVHYLTIFNQKVVGEQVILADYSLKPAADALFADAKYQEAFQKLVDMQQAGCFADAVNSTTPDSALAQFYTEQTAMYYQGTWIIGQLKDNDFEGKYGMFRMPSIDGGAGDQNYALLGPIALQVSAKTPYKAEAIEFLDFFVSKDMQLKLLTEAKRIPIRSDAVDPATTPAEIQFVLQDLAATNGAVSWLDTVLENSVSEAYLNAIQEVLGGTKTPEQAMEGVRAAALAAKDKLGK